MEFYAAVRRSVYVEGLSERAAARRFGLARETVRKMLRYRLPPGYRRAKPIRCPKLDAFTGVIDQILTDDQQRPKKQRHTAKRIWERLCVEHAFTGGYTIVKDYVRRQKLGGQEMFVPLAHPPGDAQADFGEAKAHDLVVDLPHSDDAFVQAFPAETTEAFCEGHNAAFRYFGGVPRGIVYDNTTLAVAKILGDGTRQRTQSFSELHLGRPQFSWTRIKGESDVTRRWGYGSVEGGEGSPEGDRSRRRRGGDGVGGLGAGTTVEREPETGCGVAAAAWRAARPGFA